MTHEQAPLDYEELRMIAGGHPHDAGELLEEIPEVREIFIRHHLLYKKTAKAVFFNI